MPDLTPSERVLFLRPSLPISVLWATSNLVFSQWERIFKDPMATTAAIDRLVHHAAILEFNVPSYRTRNRRNAGQRTPGDEPNREAH